MRLYEYKLSNIFWNVFYLPASRSLTIFSWMWEPYVGETHFCLYSLEAQNRKDQSSVAMTWSMNLSKNVASYQHSNNRLHESHSTAIFSRTVWNVSTAIHFCEFSFTSNIFTCKINLFYLSLPFLNL